MFSCSIEKSFKYDCIEIFIPENCVDSTILILISHGSGGIGNAEKSTAEYFLKKGFKVGLLDYFTKWQIRNNNLNWYCKRFKDDYSVTFEEMFSINFPQDKIIHIGFSLGGFLGIVNSTKFIKNYCFYPGILGFTKKLTEQDFTNTTVYIAEFDNWCDNFKNFESYCKFPPTTVFLKNSYHGYMIPNKDRELPVSKYYFPKNIMSYEEYKSLKPNHDYLASVYGFENEKIRLLSNPNSCIICLTSILKEVNEYFNIIS